MEQHPGARVQAGLRAAPGGQEEALSAKATLAFLFASLKDQIPGRIPWTETKPQTSLETVNTASSQRANLVSSVPSITQMPCPPTFQTKWASKNRSDKMRYELIEPSPFGISSPSGPHQTSKGEVVYFTKKRVTVLSDETQKCCCQTNRVSLALEQHWPMELTAMQWWKWLLSTSIVASMTGKLNF